MQFIRTKTPPIGPNQERSQHQARPLRRHLSAPVTIAPASPDTRPLRRHLSAPDILQGNSSSIGILDTASPAVYPDARGVKKYMLLSVGQRLAVTFDQATLDDMREYVKNEANKDVGVVTGWQYLLNEIRDRNVFTLPASSLKRFLQDLHGVTYPGTAILSKMARPGAFRSRQGGLVSCRVKKTSDALASASGIFFKDAFFRQYCQSRGLPDIPTCVLQGTCYDQTEEEYLVSYLAISAQCCAQLLDFPPQAEKELTERLLKEPWQFQPSLEKLHERINSWWPLHHWAISDWLEIKEIGLFSRQPSQVERENYSALYDFKLDFRVAGSL